MKLEHGEKPPKEQEIINIGLLTCPLMLKI